VKVLLFVGTHFRSF